MTALKAFSVDDPTEPLEPNEAVDAQAAACREELLTVLKKYSASIGGCGCCGSPHLQIGDRYYNDFHLHFSSGQ